MKRISMKGFLTALAINVLSVVTPVIALATTYTYNINIPVDVERIAPAGSYLSIDCVIYPGDPVYGSHNGMAFGLDNTGTYIGTVPISITTSSPQKSYTGKFSSQVTLNGRPDSSVQLPSNLLVGVSGSVPGITIAPIKPYAPKPKIKIQPIKPYTP